MSAEMNICSERHQEVVYTSRFCPFCEVMGQLDSVESARDKYAEEIKDLENSVEELEGEVTDLQGEITDLKNEIGRLENAQS